MLVSDIRQVKVVSNDSALALLVPRFEFGKGSRSLKSHMQHKEMFDRGSRSPMVSYTPKFNFLIGCMVYEKLGEQVFGTTGKLVIFGATSLQNTGGKSLFL